MSRAVAETRPGLPIKTRPVHAGVQALRAVGPIVAGAAGGAPRGGKTRQTGGAPRGKVVARQTGAAVHSAVVCGTVAGAISAEPVKARGRAAGRASSAVGAVVVGEAGLAVVGDVKSGEAGITQGPIPTRGTDTGTRAGGAAAAAPVHTGRTGDIALRAGEAGIAGGTEGRGVEAGGAGVAVDAHPACEAAAAKTISVCAAFTDAGNAGARAGTDGAIVIAGAIIARRIPGDSVDADTTVGGGIPAGVGGAGTKAISGQSTVARTPVQTRGAGGASVTIVAGVAPGAGTIPAREVCAGVASRSNPAGVHWTGAAAVSGAPVIAGPAGTGTLSTAGAVVARVAPVAGSVP